jgi:hypothetical protein
MKPRPAGSGILKLLPDQGRPSRTNAREKPRPSQVPPTALPAGYVFWRTRGVKRPTAGWSGCGPGAALVRSRVRSLSPELWPGAPPGRLLSLRGPGWWAIRPIFQSFRSSFVRRPRVVVIGGSGRAKLSALPRWRSSGRKGQRESLPGAFGFGQLLVARGQCRFLQFTA